MADKDFVNCAKMTVLGRNVRNMQLNRAMQLLYLFHRFLHVFFIGFKYNII